MSLEKGKEIVDELYSDMNREILAIRGDGSFFTKNGQYVSPYDVLQQIEKIRGTVIKLSHELNTK